MKKSLLLALFSSWCLSPGTTRAQDPLAAADGIPVPLPNQVGVLVEWVEMDAGAANKLIRKHLSTIKPDSFRDEIEKHIDSGDAAVWGTSYLKTKPGMRAKLESGDTVEYPTEFYPPSWPESLLLVGGTAPLIAATPASFETRNIGPTIVIEPNIDAAGTVIDLVITSEWTEIEEKEPVSKEDSPNAENADIWTPKFYTMKATTALELHDGVSRLLHVATPRAEGKLILVFVQASILR